MRDQFRAVVFDYGHTFIDFSPFDEQLVEAYTEIRDRLVELLRRELPGASDLVRDVVRRVERQVQESYGRGVLEEMDIVAMYAEALAEIGLSLAPGEVRHIVEHEHRARASELTIQAENLQVLPDLRDLGLKIGLVSNAHFLPELMLEDIERLGIAQYVDAAVISSGFGLRKPHPDIFMKVLDELEVLPWQAVFVGDRLKDDIGGAKALGMRGVLTHQFRQEALDSQPVMPDLVIERLPEVVPYLRGLLME